MNIIWMAFVGLIAGALAKLVMPGKDPGGILVTMLLGMSGALLATFLGQAIGWYGPNEGARFVGAFVGAVILLVIYRLATKNRRRTV